MLITAADIAQILSDWGDTVTHRTVLATFDPDTQAVAEVVTDLELPAIVSTCESRQAPDTAGRAQLVERVFRFAAGSVPELPPLAVQRLVHDGHEYDVVEEDHHSSTDLVRLVGRLRA